MHHQLSLRSNNRVALMAPASHSKTRDTLDDDDSDNETFDDLVEATEETVREREARHDEEMLYVPEEKKKVDLDRANLASTFCYSYTILFDQLSFHSISS